MDIHLSLLIPNFDAIKILVGSNEFLNTTSILEMNEPLIWLEIEDNSPILLNAIFYIMKITKNSIY